MQHPRASYFLPGLGAARQKILSIIFWGWAQIGYHRTVLVVQCCIFQDLHWSPITNSNMWDKRVWGWLPMKGISFIVQGLVSHFIDSTEKQPVAKVKSFSLNNKDDHSPSCFTIHLLFLSGNWLKLLHLCLLQMSVPGRPLVPCHPSLCGRPLPLRHGHAAEDELQWPRGAAPGPPRWSHFHWDGNR